MARRTTHGIPCERRVGYANSQKALLPKSDGEQCALGAFCSLTRSFLLMEAMAPLAPESPRIQGVQGGFIFSASARFGRCGMSFCVSLPVVRNLVSAWHSGSDSAQSNCDARVCMHHQHDPGLLCPGRGTNHEVLYASICLYVRTQGLTEGHLFCHLVSSFCHALACMPCEGCTQVYRWQFESFLYQDYGNLHMGMIEGLPVDHHYSKCRIG